MPPEVLNTEVLNTEETKGLGVVKNEKKNSNM